MQCDLIQMLCLHVVKYRFLRIDFFWQTHKKETRAQYLINLLEVMNYGWRHESVKIKVKLILQGFVDLICVGNSKNWPFVGFMTCFLVLSGLVFFVLLKNVQQIKVSFKNALKKKVYNSILQRWMHKFLFIINIFKAWKCYCWTHFCAFFHDHCYCCLLPNFPPNLFPTTIYNEFNFLLQQWEKQNYKEYNRMEPFL